MEIVEDINVEIDEISHLINLKSIDSNGLKFICKVDIRR